MPGRGALDKFVEAQARTPACATAAVGEAAQQAAEAAGGGLAQSVFPGDNRRR